MKTTTMLRLLTSVTSKLLLGTLFLGCVGAPQDDPEEGRVSETSAALTGYVIGARGTTTSVDALDLGVLIDDWTCFLNTIAGNLTEGGGGAEGVLSGAGITGVMHDPINLNSQTYGLYARGGAYSWVPPLVSPPPPPTRVWANNPVMGGATCVHYPMSAWNGWVSQPIHSASNTTPLGIAPPTRIGDLNGSAGVRQCFLFQVLSGYDLWTSSTFARVVKKTSTDATHPQTGWYVESNAVSTLPSSTWGRHDVTAWGACADFPAGSGLWGGAFSAPAGGSVTNVLTTGGSSGIKACGLTEIAGPFDQDSWTDGVTINPPATVNGQWTMTVTNGKWGAATCVE